jgi:hypothetical protein
MSVILLQHRESKETEVPSEFLLDSVLVSMSILVMILVVIYLISRKSKGT